MRLSERLGRILTAIETRWSLILLLQGSGLMASFALPAWAVHSAKIFMDYSPASWVVAGFAGVTITTICYALWQWGFRIRVRAKYDYRMLAGPDPINPLGKTFEGKRIYLNDFVLPSHTIIDGKTFIDCEIIGPANLYWFVNNQATELKLPKIDAVYLDPSIKFTSGFLLQNCIFRGCSFQRITLFVGQHDYQAIKNHAILNWISFTPDSNIQPELKLVSPQGSPIDSQPPQDTEQKT